MVNLSAAILFHARTTPEREALIFGDTRISYAALADRCGTLAAFLLEHGVKPDDRVAVLMKNSATLIELAIATSHVGGVFLPINYRLARDEVSYIVADAQASMLFVDAELADNAAGLPKVVVVSEAAQRDSTLLAGGWRPTPPLVPRLPDDLFRLMYTSGTTDHPKGVMHTYSNIYWKNIDHVIALGLTAAERLLVVGPLYHVGAFDLPGVAVLWLGGLMCIERAFDPVAAMQRIERERITGVWMAPMMLNAIVEASAAQRFDVSSLKWCIGGGERTPESRIRAFTEIFSAGRYIDAYGLTESYSGDTFMEQGREIEKIGTVGRPTPHVQVEIRDEAGRTLPPGIEGEICLRGPKITKGYWRNPEKTRASFFDDWFRTGDIGVLDGDGFLTITDRRKDMIISGGENIASSEVERVIYQLAQISEAAVIGLPDPQWGERPVLVAVLKPGAELDLETVTRHCRQHIAAFKVPKELHLRTALPRNPSGKILKRVLRNEFAS